MATTAEPRFARIAALLADPSRARMLALLLAGEARSAGELARAVGITPQTASTHLAALRDAGLVAQRTQGRHRYFSLADGDVAHMLETLSLVAERDEVSTRWIRPDRQPLKHARSCYCHLAGELGVQLRDALLARQVLVANERGEFSLGRGAGAWLQAAHFDDAAIQRTQRDTVRPRFAYACMDWSERREHLAGALPKALLSQFIATGWLQRVGTTRALVETPAGVRHLLPLIRA